MQTLKGRFGEMSKPGKSSQTKGTLAGASLGIFTQVPQIESPYRTYILRFFSLKNPLIQFLIP